MTKREMESLAHRLKARADSKLSPIMPELVKDLKQAASLIEEFAKNIESASVP